MGKFLNQLSERLKLTDKNRYYRGQYQSFMTGPEWRNVEMANEYAAFLRDNRSLFHFPYFRQIAGLWRVIFKSWRAASRYDRQREILLSEYTMMDLFVGVFTTMELLPKAFFALLLSPFINKDNPTTVQHAMAEYYEQYSRDLQTVPFYDHDYQSYYHQLKKTYRDSGDRSWGDWFSWTVVALELKARYWISKPLHYWFHQENNLVPATTDVLVKTRLKGEWNSTDAKDYFVHLLKQTQRDDISYQEEDIHVKETQQKKGQTYTSVYARLHTPRYAAFVPAVQSLTEQNIAVRTIAGQAQVQVKCVVDGGDKAPVVPRALDSARALYSYGDNIHPGKRYSLFDVPVRDLQDSVAQFERQDGVKVEFIHNF